MAKSSSLRADQTLQFSNFTVLTINDYVKPIPRIITKHEFSIIPISNENRFFLHILKLHGQTFSYGHPFIEEKYVCNMTRFTIRLERIQNIGDHPDFYVRLS